MAKYARSVMRGTSRHGVARVYRGAPDPVVIPAPDNRGRPAGNGQQGEITCPECTGTVRLARASFSSVETGIRARDIIIPNHRVGGGRYSASRGDALCKRSLTHP
jgi:hypothetical protein